MEPIRSRMATPWRFGVDPLDQAVALAPLLRRVAGLVISLENPEPAVDRLIDELHVGERALTAAAPADPAPRVGTDPADDRRVYVDHSQDIGAYNPCFPEYAIEVNGERASGTVTFPLIYEGPPGIVHGGFLALFFDCVIQDHNCEVGQAGKTASLTVSYHQPTPLLTTLDFDVHRAVADRRIRSTARISLDGVQLCSASMDAVAGERSRLPEVSPRRSPL